MPSAPSVRRLARLSPILIASVSVEGEDVQVLRASASALGAIGVDAAGAIPALQKLVVMPRVQWAAEDAIQKIRP